MSTVMDEFEKAQMKESVPFFSVGDTVDVSVRIIEGSKERIQIFSGTVIARKEGNNRACFTVRRIVAGEGVERVFPLHSPWIEDIAVRRHGKVRRAKLYYLRDRVGKATKTKELQYHERLKKEESMARHIAAKAAKAAKES